MNKEFWSNKRVLITGASGFKGSYLSLWLSSLGAKVYGYSLNENVSDPNLFTAARVGEEINHFCGDICDYTRLEDLLIQANPDIVFHMAAQPIVIEAYKDPLYTFKTNTLGTATILDCIRKHPGNIKTITLITTDKVYRNNEWEWGYRENDTLGGICPYSSSKSCAELVADSYRESYFKKIGIDLSTVRAGNVIGGGDWANVRLIPDFMRAITVGKRFTIQYPDAVRPWQLVLEPLHGYIMLTEQMYNNPGKFAEAWNFGPNDEMVITVSDILTKLCNLWGNGAGFDVNEPDSRYHQHMRLTLDSAKAKLRLGWSNKCSIDYTLEKIIEFAKDYLDNRNIKETCLRQIKEYEKLL